MKYLRAIQWCGSSWWWEGFHAGINQPEITVLPIFLLLLHITCYGSHLFGLQSVSASQQNTTIHEISGVGSLPPQRSIHPKSQIDESVLCLLLWKFLLRLSKRRTTMRIESCQTSSIRITSRLITCDQALFSFRSVKHSILASDQIM